MIGLIFKSLQYQQLASTHCPVKQSSFIFHEGSWRVPETQPTVENWPKIGLLTWNINYIRPDLEARTNKAMEFLCEISVKHGFDKFPQVIHLQEITLTSLNIIRASRLIRERFQITDLDPTRWPSKSQHGLLTLIDRRLPIASTFRIPFQSKAGRYALFVDIKIYNEFGTQSNILRICNVHLESYNSVPRLRPAQLASMSDLLHAPDVRAGIVAGEFNALHKTHDYELHRENDLKYAYLENGGTDGGNTWGMHSSCPPGGKVSRRYQEKRLDKILYTGGVLVGKPRTFGRGLRIDEVDGDEWVSDHLGLRAILKIQ